MRKTKTTPEQRQEIVRRVKAGEKGRDIAKEFNVHESYVSRLCQAEQPPPLPDNALDLKRKSDADLKSLFTKFRKDIHRIEYQRFERREEIFNLEDIIKREQEKHEKVAAGSPLRKAINQTITAYRHQIDALSDTSEDDQELCTRYQCLAHIANEFLRRGISIPVYHSRHQPPI